MLKFSIIRVSAYVLALVFLLLAWQYTTEFVNDALDLAEMAARAISERVAGVTGLDPLLVEALLLDRMHLGRTIMLGAVMLFVFVLILMILDLPITQQIVRFFLTIILAHVLLTATWILFTEETRSLYDWHYDRVQEVLRYFELYKTETLFLRFGQVHSLLVIVEVLLLIGVVRLMLVGGYKRITGKP